MTADKNDIDKNGFMAFLKRHVSVPDYRHRDYY